MCLGLSVLKRVLVASGALACIREELGSILAPEINKNTKAVVPNVSRV